MAGGIVAAVLGRDRMGGQFVRFVAVGLLSTLLDGIVYRLLLGETSIEAAKAAGYLTGTACSILCNYRWTFAHGGAGGKGIVAKCALLYLTALAINVAANGLALALLPAAAFAKPAAFLFAVGVTTVYNFVGMRWIFARARSAAGRAGDLP